MSVQFLQRLPQAALLGLGLFIAVAAPSAAHAAELRSGAGAVVTSAEAIDDDLFIAGEAITIAGRVTGDTYASGRTVVVSGTVDGDLIAAAQQVVVDGTVTGDVRAAGAAVTVNGQVGRNVTALAQQVAIGSTARVGGSLLGAGETLSVLGPIGRGLTFGGGTAHVAAPIGGDVMARVESLSLAPTARIAGDLVYQSEQQIAPAPGTVGGEVRFTPVAADEPAQPPLLNGLLDVSGLVWLVGLGLLGAAAIMLAPRTAARAVDAGREQPLASFGIGLAVLVLAPIVAVVIGVTLVGIPLAIVLLGMYALGLVLAWPALGLVVGLELAQLVRRGAPLAIFGALAIGLIVLHLVTHIPFIGGLVGFLGLCFGLGVIVQVIRGWRAAPRAEPAPAVSMPVAA